MKVNFQAGLNRDLTGGFMKRYLKILLVVLIIWLCMGFVGYSYNLNNIQIRLVGSQDNRDSKPLKYHFMVITQDIGDTFWQSVKAGAEKAGVNYDAAIEFNGSKIQDEEEELDYLNIAIASHVDGIVVYVTDENKFTPLINKAVSQGIHVVTIESDDKGSDRAAYVGPNSYTAGYDEGNLVTEASSGVSNVAMIIGGNYAGGNGAKDSLLAGFNDSIHGHNNITLKTVQVSDSGYFGAETIIRNILNEYPTVNTVVCTGSDDTLEIVQVLIDLNRESDITVIGYNNTPQIRGYIKNNVMFGSVYEDPAKTGYKSIEALVQCLDGQKIPSFIDTGVYTITRSNLLSYPAGS
jgi:ribose transport system substrate-binding protein